MKNIVFVIDDLRSGGAQRQMVALAKDFKTNGYDVTVLYYYPHCFYKEYLHTYGIKTICNHVNNPVKRILSFRGLIKRQKPDVVIAFMGIPSLLAVLASIPYKNWKLILGERSADPKILKSVKSKLIRYTYFFADYIVANSNTNIDIVRRVNPYLKKERLKVIYNSIDLNLFVPPVNYYFKKNNILKIVIPASYRRLKNLFGLIEALNLLSLEAKLMIKIDWYGAINYENKAENVYLESKKMIDEYNLHKVIFLNDVKTNMHEIIREYDAVGLFSMFEGLPNAICEGMACGKPIICSNVSDLPDLIKDEINGFLFNPASTIQIAEAIMKLIALTPEQLSLMGRKNREKAELLFDNNSIFNQYENLIK